MKYWRKLKKSWQALATIEGLLRTASRLIIKAVGISAKSMGGALISGLVIGITQVVAGLILAKKGSIRNVKPKYLLGSIFLGLVLSGTVIFGVMTFIDPRADVGISSFLLCSSVILAVFVDWIFFKGSRINLRQCFGVLVFLGAGYILLGRPRLSELLALPAWVWWSIGTAVTAVGAEATTKWVRGMNPFAYNFFAGLTTILVCAVTLSLMSEWSVALDLPIRFWAYTFLIGFLAVIIIFFKVKTYGSVIGGARIAPKDVTMKGTFLTAVTLFGIIVYGEPATWDKVVGITGFFVSFILINNDTWLAIKKRWI